MSRKIRAYLVSITPEEVLRPDVHIWVLDAFLDRWLMRLVLPVLSPQPPRIHSSDTETWDDDVDGEFAPEICNTPALLEHLCQSNIFQTSGTAASVPHSQLYYSSLVFVVGVELAYLK